MTNASRAAYDVAFEYLGLEEYPGARHNETVVSFAEAVGQGWVKDDETPWCASFVGAVLAQIGLPHTGKLNARSYLNWGTEVSLKDAVIGDVVVFWRDSADSWKGHVGFYAGMNENGDIFVLGGNQGDKVSKVPYPANRLLGVRRAKQPRDSVAQTKTAKVSTVQIVAGISGMGTAIAGLEGNAQMVAVVGGLVMVAFGLWFFRNRLADFVGGVK